MRALYSQIFLNHVLNIISQRELPLMLEETLRAVRDELQVTQASIILVDKAQHRVLETVGNHYTDTDFDTLWDGVEGWVMREKQPTLTQDITNDLRTSSRAMAALNRHPKTSTVSIAPIGDFGIIAANGDNLSPVNLHILHGYGQTLAAGLRNLDWGHPEATVPSPHNDVYSKMIHPSGDFQAMVQRTLQQVEQNQKPTRLAIVGADGTGKSAFANWVASQAKRQNFYVASTIAYPHDVAYGVWLRLLILLYPELEGLQADEAGGFLAALNAEWDMRAGLLMEILQPGQARPAYLEGYTVEQRRAAVAALITDLILSYKKPLALILEDIHEMEAASRFVLVHFAHHLAYQDTHVLLCLTTDDEKTVPNGTTIHHLDMLDSEGVSAFRKILIGNDLANAAQVDQVLLEITHGDPLHVQMLVGTLVDKGLLHSPTSLEKADLLSLVEAAYQRGNERLQKILSVAAAIPTPFTEAYLAATYPEIQVHLETVDVQPFLLKLENGRWVFRSNLFRKIVLELTPAEERKQIHQRLAEYIERQNPTYSSQIAYHYQNSTQPELARLHLVQATHAAHAVGSYDEAVAYINQAIDTEGTLNNMDRFVILTEQADLCGVVQDYEKQANTLQKLSEIASDMDDAWLYADSGWRWLQHYRDTNQTAEGIATWKIFYEQAEKAYHTIARAEISIAAAQLHQQLGQYDAAQAYLDQAAQIAGQTRKMALGARILFTLGTVFETTANYDMAQAALEQAYEVYHQEDNRVGLANSLTELGKMYQRIGYLQTAQEYLERAYNFWMSMGNFNEGIEAGLSLAELLIQQKRPVAAIENIMELQTPVNRLANAVLQGRWWYIYGLACSEIQSYPQAVGCYTQALNLYPESLEKERNEAYIQLAHASQQTEQDSQQWVEKVTDPTLEKYAYSPLTYMNFAAVVAESSQRATILEVGQQHIRQQAEKIQDEKVRRHYLARPDRQQLLNVDVVK